MQLPVSGHPLHTRSLACVLCVCEDGRWLARGEVIDLRKCSFVPMVSDIQPAGIIHHMRIELDLAPADLRMEAIRVSQPVVAVEPSVGSGGECCRDPAPRLQALAGERLDAGFAKQLSGVFGGRLGCSHLLTLFHAMAGAVARGAALESQSLRAQRGAGERFFRRAIFVDGYELEDGAIELALQLSDYHTRPDLVVRRALERLDEQAETRVHGRVPFPAVELQGLCAAERRRSAETLASAEWRDRTERVRALEGSPLMGGGFARRVFAELPDPDDVLLRDALLQLAPGYIQVTAAITERFFAAAAAGEPRTARPLGGTLGGQNDSCYVWRAGGPMQRARERENAPSDEE